MFTAKWFVAPKIPKCDFCTILRFEWPFHQQKIPWAQRYGTCEVSNFHDVSDVNALTKGHTVT